MPTELDSDLFGIDLVTAYRKAKVDLFYDDSPRRIDLVKYEEALSENLRSLRGRLAGDDETWVLDPAFLGTFTFVPKALKEPKRVHRSFWSAPAKTWRGHWNGDGERPDAEFRLMADCSIDMHVFSTLWMLHVGTFLDMQLDDSARGSRLAYQEFGAVEHLKLGTFENYQYAYRRWRDDGLESMANGLNDGLDVIAMTADITAFYHRLDVRFLLDDQFLGEVMGVELGEWQLKLHRLFVSALHAWSTQVGEVLDWERCGLPVGLPASAVVANLALAQLDKVINGMEPLFYGRYVDDILLVVEDQGDTENQAAFLAYLAERSDGLLLLESTGPDPRDLGLKFVPDYLSTSLVMFENEKNKTFHLSSASGHAVIEAIRANIQERNSEWRALAVVPSDVGDIEPSIAQARRSDGDPALTLRDADEISARKQSFSIRIRDFEGFERNLPPEAWEEERRTFFHAVCEHVLSLPSVFELAAFLPRLVSLCAASADSDALIPTLAILPGLPEEVRATCDVKVSDFPIGEARREIILSRWASHLGNQAVDGFARGWMAPVTGTTIREVRKILEGLRPRHSDVISRVAALVDAHQRLAQRDLAHRPYRWGVLGLNKGEKVRSATKQQSVPLHPILRDALNQLARAVPEWFGRTLNGNPIGSFDAGLAFATRPPSMMELYRVLGSREPDDYGLADSTLVERILNGVRGRFGHPHTYLQRRTDQPDVIHVPTGHMKSPVTIALVMMETDEQNTIDSANGVVPSKGQRYNSIRALLESVRKGVDDGKKPNPDDPFAGKPDYVLLPELSMPRDWFDEFALALMRSGISLIAGIEHQQRPNSGISNQVWAALRTNNSRSDFFPHRQDKQAPAIPELPILAHTKTHWSPEFEWKWPPVIEHGDFRFGLLICSEFTNINYRARLRGNVDALFVPEWNQDLHSFEALVEASALDLHAYIAQANTRGYGDTRLRAPAKRDWGRDVVRLKGGQHDYFVVGEMDYESLRKFQNTPVVVPPYKPKAPEPIDFKPMPDGFVLDPDRNP
jgi:hypothetical protein